MGEQLKGGFAGIVSSNSVVTKVYHITGEVGMMVPDQEYRRSLINRLFQHLGELRENERASLYI